MSREVILQDEYILRLFQQNHKYNLSIFIINVIILQINHFVYCPLYDCGFQRAYIATI